VLDDMPKETIIDDEENFEDLIKAVHKED